MKEEKKIEDYKSPNCPYCGGSVGDIEIKPERDDVAEGEAEMEASETTDKMWKIISKRFKQRSRHNILTL